MRNLGGIAKGEERAGGAAAPRTPTRESPPAGRRLRGVGRNASTWADWPLPVGVGLLPTGSRAVRGGDSVKGMASTSTVRRPPMQQRDGNWVERGPDPAPESSPTTGTSAKPPHVSHCDAASGLAVVAVAARADAAPRGD